MRAGGSSSADATLVGLRVTIYSPMDKDGVGEEEEGGGRLFSR
jgi:hypothetical protein